MSTAGSAGWMDPWRWPEVPVICGGNQPELGLAGGDLGVKLGSGEQSRVLFGILAADGRRSVGHPARLTFLEPALARLFIEPKAVRPIASLCSGRRCNRTMPLTTSVFSTRRLRGRVAGLDHGRGRL